MQRSDLLFGLVAGWVRLAHLNDYNADGGMANAGAGTLDFLPEPY